MGRRLLYLDVLRGFFIGYVILIHGIAHFALHSGEGSVDIDPTLMVILSPFILMATWAPIFVLISGTANSFVLYNTLNQKYQKSPEKDHNVDLNKLLKGQLINSSFLYIFSLMNMGLFHYGIKFGGVKRYSLITGSIELGYFQLGDPLLLLFSDAIALMSISGFVTTGILYLIWSHKGFLKRKRNYWIIIITAIIWFLVSTPIHAVLDPIYNTSFEEKNYIVTLLLKSIIGVTESNFPNVGFSIVGLAFGCALAEELDIKKIQIFGYGFGLVTLIIAIFIIKQLGVSIGVENIGLSLPHQIQILNLAIMLFITTFMISKMEYQSKKRRITIAKHTIIFRRLGLMALTLFMLESVIAISIKKLLNPLWSLFDLTILNVPALLIYIGIIFLVWYIILKIWERFEFKYSFEWFLIQIVGKLRGRKSSRLNIESVLYNPVED